MRKVHCAGVESVAVDSEVGKVTVVGRWLAASTLVKKLARAGKYAALWTSAANYPAAAAREHDSSSGRAKYPKHYFTTVGSSTDHESSTSTSTHVNNLHNDSITRKLHIESAQDDGAAGGEADISNYVYQNSEQLMQMSHDVNYYMNSSSKKIMQPLHGAAPLMSDHASQLLSGIKTLIRSADVEKKYDNEMMDSVEYATNMFSDENAHSCSLM